MSAYVTVSVDEVISTRAAVFENQGIPPGAQVGPDVDSVYDQALELFPGSVTPRGLLSEIPKADFEGVYRGEGDNESRSPVADIFPRADYLALFAVTLGQDISDRIRSCFETADFALGAMLDSVASAATDKLADVVQGRFVTMLAEAGRATAAFGVLRYSPGYCGWHMSGQKRLFEFLQPGRIGISLGDTLLMQPLKSISGVMIAGPKEMHCMADDYPFCERCRSRGCRARIRALLAE